MLPNISRSNRPAFPGREEESHAGRGDPSFYLFSPQEEEGPLAGWKWHLQLRLLHFFVGAPSERLLTADPEPPPAPSGACWNRRFWGSTLELLDQKFHGAEGCLH